MARRKRRPESYAPGYQHEKPRRDSRGRPRSAKPPRDDGVSEGCIRNLIGRYGPVRVRHLIKAWQKGDKTDRELGAGFGISGRVMCRWRHAFGIRQSKWEPYEDISSLLSGGGST